MLPPWFLWLISIVGAAVLGALAAARWLESRRSRRPAASLKTIDEIVAALVHKELAVARAGDPRTPLPPSPIVLPPPPLAEPPPPRRSGVHRALVTEEFPREQTGFAGLLPDEPPATPPGWRPRAITEPVLERTPTPRERATVIVSAPVVANDPFDEDTGSPDSTRMVRRDDPEAIAPLGIEDPHGKVRHG